MPLKIQFSTKLWRLCSSSLLCQIDTTNGFLNSDIKFIDKSAFSASYSKINPCSTAGKRIGVWTFHATCERQKITIFTDIVYGYTGRPFSDTHFAVSPETASWTYALPCWSCSLRRSRRRTRCSSTLKASPSPPRRSPSPNLPRKTRTRRAPSAWWLLHLLPRATSCDVVADAGPAPAAGTRRPPRTTGWTRRGRLIRPTGSWSFGGGPSRLRSWPRRWRRGSRHRCLLLLGTTSFWSPR